jgi:ankyrin repeat protein
MNGEVGVVKSILAYEGDSLDFNALDFDNMTPLDCAISVNRLDLFKLLLADTRIDPNKGGRILNSSLNYCINLLQEEFVKALIQKKGVSLKILDENGNSVFHIIMKRFRRNPEAANSILRLIIAQASKSDLLQLNMLNKFSMTPIHCGIESRCTEAVSELFLLNRTLLKE